LWGAAFALALNFKKIVDVIKRRNKRFIYAVCGRSKPAVARPLPAHDQPLYFLPRTPPVYAAAPTGSAAATVDWGAVGNARAVALASAGGASASTGDSAVITHNPMRLPGSTAARGAASQTAASYAEARR
jgi:hypothetical protein